jgi:hypothetical protein
MNSPRVAPKQISLLLFVLVLLPSIASADSCPNDPRKTTPGVCGCGVPDRDSNRNRIVDCLAAADLKAQVVKLQAALRSASLPSKNVSASTAKTRAQKVLKAVTGLQRFWDQITAPVTFTTENPVEGASAVGDKLELLGMRVTTLAKLSKRSFGPAKQQALTLALEITGLIR